MRIVATVTIYCLLLAQPVFAAGNSWNKIRYEGGTVEAKVNPFDWNTTLTVSGAEIELVFAGHKKASIAIKNVTALTYGQKAYRRVADMVALSAVVTPVALFGLLHKSKDHVVGIEFTTAAGDKGAVLLMVHKDSFHELLQTLKAATGKPVDNWP